MRSPIRAPAVFTLALVTSLVACFACASDKSTASAEAKPSAQAGAPVEIDGRALAEARVGEAVAPRLGGSVAWVDDYQVEVAVHEDGAVRGLVFDAEGNALAHAGVTDFKLALRGEGGAKHDVALDWDEACACYRGQAGVSAGLVPEPLDVSFGSLGRTHTGVLSNYALLASGGASQKAASQDAASQKAASQKIPGQATGGQATGAAKKAGSAEAHLNARASAKLPPKTKNRTKTKRPAKSSVPKATAKHSVQKSGSGGGVKAGASLGFGTK
jgi:hypothetical protein